MKPYDINPKQVRLELLVFDNASDDETYSYLQLHQKQDKRIKIFHSDEEENIATIKNTLLKNAKGEIVTFLPIAEFDASFLQYIARKMNAEKYDALILRTNMEYKILIIILPTLGLAFFYNKVCVFSF